MQKLTLIILAIVHCHQPLRAQNLNIPTSLITQNTPKYGSFSEVIYYKGNFEDVDFWHGKPPKLLKYNDLYQKYVYTNRCLEKMSLCKRSMPDQVLAQFECEYSNEKLQKITGYHMGSGNARELGLFQTIQLKYDQDFIKTETVKNHFGELTEQYDYESTKQTGKFPLIQYTHTAFENGKPGKKTRNVLQYDDRGLVFYCSLEGKDTVFSIVSTWHSQKECTKRVFDGKTRSTNLIAVYHDSLGNPVLTISEIHTPGKGIKKEVNYTEIKYLNGQNVIEKQPVDQSFQMESQAPDTNKQAPETEAPASSVVDSTGTPVFWDDAPEAISTPPFTIDPDKIYEHYSVDQQPIFQGGEADYLQYIQTNLKYPAAAKTDHVQGMVVVSFVVEKDGSLSEIELKRDIGRGCGTEAVRLFQQMPKWKPGQVAGIPVRVRITKPIRFKL